MTEVKTANSGKQKASKKEDKFIQEVLNDFRLCCLSREASLLARKEVLTGKAKFGIIGDGKELAQVALAKSFRKGDWRSGYYRDQTLMFALGLSTTEDFFAQLYADPDNDPFSKGRQMNCHFASATIDNDGHWLPHKDLFNISSDVSPTGGQMARALGLALASKKYRGSKALQSGTPFSNKGNEVVFVTIGDASTSEGAFWETVNAACVMRVPMVISVWDDGYGISVPTEYQTTKGSISEALEGFRLDEHGNGMDIYTGYGWDYPGLCALYEQAVEKTRSTHIPCLIHIKEVTQPQGHSTSGSHERYKSKERLQWEVDYDCIKVMGDWMVKNGLATPSKIEAIREESKAEAKSGRERAWKAFTLPIKQTVEELKHIFNQVFGAFPDIESTREISLELNNLLHPQWSEVVQLARKMSFLLKGKEQDAVGELNTWLDKNTRIAKDRYQSHLYSHSSEAALKVPVIQPLLNEESPVKNGYEILNTFFDKKLAEMPGLFAFGEDVGNIGDVNQGFAGMQEKYGEARVFDTGIREWTIMGQAIGMAMRGLRPIAEIQYLDYLIFGLEPLTDDLATLRWRTAGQQKAPAIIRTRGHRLEGIWHAGSPLGMILHSLRGIYVCVPRNMVQAAGMYNTLLCSDDPGLVIECLNGYRLKEKLPANIGEYTVPLGVPEVLQEGEDITLVTYGSCVRVAQEGIKMLEKFDISVELIDVQTLLPFDLEHRIVESLKKTNRIIFLDEDVPGGATSYMMQQVLEVQGGYQFLDAQPRTLTAAEHRPPYGSDGDYFSKPNPEDVFEAVYEQMREAQPSRFP